MASQYPTQDPDLQSDLQNNLDVETLRASTQQAIDANDIGFQFAKLAQDFTLTILTSGNQLAGVEYDADKQLAGVIYTVDHQLAREVQLAQIDANARVQVAQLGLTGTEYDADRQLQGVTYETDQRNTLGKYTVDTQNSIHSAEINLDFAARQFTAQASKDASVFGSQADLTGRQYAADQGLIGDKYQADRQLASAQLTQKGENDRLITKLNYADGKFNLVYPFVQKSINDAASGSTTTPNLSFNAPFVSASGYYSAGDIQAQVNATFARNDSRTATQVRQMQGDLAGRGFSSNSPLAAMLSVGLFGQNLQANTEGEREARFRATKENGDAVFQAQQLLQQQFNQQQQAALESEKNQVTRQVGLVGSLAQLIGGLT